MTCSVKWICTLCLWPALCSKVNPMGGQIPVKFIKTLLMDPGIIKHFRKVFTHKTKGAFEGAEPFSHIAPSAPPKAPLSFVCVA